MKIAVLGTGTVGRTIAARLADLGHEVVIGTRDPEATRARTETDAMGTPPISAWLAEHQQCAWSPSRTRRPRRSSSSTPPTARRPSRR